MELASLAFVEHAENVVFLGPLNPCVHSHPPGSNGVRDHSSPVD
jgi:hypothetical protein